MNMIACLVCHRCKRFDTHWRLKYHAQGFGFFVAFVSAVAVCAAVFNPSKGSVFIKKKCIYTPRNPEMILHYMHRSHFIYAFTHPCIASRHPIAHVCIRNQIFIRFPPQYSHTLSGTSSVIGVAISASLLPPLVNGGFLMGFALWASYVSCAHVHRIFARTSDTSP